MNDNQPPFLQTPFERRHIPIVVVAFVLAVVVGALLARCYKAHSTGVITGNARIIDGDTFDLGAERIRVWGIDAPERAGSCLRRGEPWRPYNDASAPSGRSSMVRPSRASRSSGRSAGPIHDSSPSARLPGEISAS